MAKNKIRIFTLAVIVVLAPLTVNEYRKLPNGKLQMVFCDVGQGDAAYIKTPQGQDILIDGGPNDKVLECLSHHMNFWDRNLELVILTHPQADHAAGLISVLKNYQVENFLTGPEGNDSEIWRQIRLALASQKQTKIANPAAGDRVKIGEVVLETIWPNGDYLAANTFGGEILPGGVVLGASTEKDLNSFSLVLQLRYKDFTALFTGDVDENLLSGLPDVDLVKVPHHGSKTGLQKSFWEQTRPETAVISVGKDNKFGHPSPEVLAELSQIGAKVLRTDRDGEVAVEL